MSVILNNLMGCGSSKSTESKTPAPLAPQTGGKAITFHYFNLMGRGEAIRMLLAHKQIQYTDHRIEFQEWPAIKPTLEFGTVPFMEIDGKKLQATTAILGYLARKNDLYPTDKYDVYLSESIVDLAEDCIGFCLRTMAVEKNPAGVEAFLVGDSLKKLKIMENRLLKNQGGRGYFIGNSISYCDFVVFSYIHSHYFLQGQESRLAELSHELPTIKAYVLRVLAISPGITNYLKTRPKTPA